jgi:hypothetical protein
MRSRAGRAPPTLWPADFYLNNTVFRLAALDERLAKYMKAVRFPEATRVLARFMVTWPLR